jgi:hypothetical protein
MRSSKAKQLAPPPTSRACRLNPRLHDSIGIMLRHHHVDSADTALDPIQKHTRKSAIAA